MKRICPICFTELPEEANDYEYGNVDAVYYLCTWWNRNFSIPCERSCTGDKGNADTEKDPDQCGGAWGSANPDTDGSGSSMCLLQDCN